MKHRSKRRTHRIKIILSIILLVSFLISINAAAQEETPTVEPPTATAEIPSPTIPPTEASPSEPVTVTESTEVTSPPTSEAPTATETTDPAPEATDLAPEATDPAEVTTEPTETATDAPTTTPEETPTATATVTVPPPAPVPLAMQDFCQMDIGDRGDTNAFTYTFAAINVSGIASYAWTITQGGNPVTSSTSQSFDYDFTATGSYNIELVCTTTSGVPLTLNGNITISNSPVANFTLAPDGDPSTVFIDGFPPFTVTGYNTSSSATQFLWEVTQFPVGAGPFAPLNTTSASATYTNTFTIVGTYRIQLTATDPSGFASVYFLDVVVKELPPRATFTITPSNGTAPLDVVIQATEDSDPQYGDVATWSWDFGGGVVQGTPNLNSPGPFIVRYTTENINPYIVTLNYSNSSGSGMVQRQVSVFPSGENVDAQFTWESEGNVAANVVRVCFTNNSTGPVGTSVWNFGDGTPPLTDNSTVVCHDFTVSGSSANFTVTLDVTSVDTTSTSQDVQTLTLYNSPVANFTESSSNITWGSTVNFTDTSTGVITSWAWDFNGDGVTDSTSQNPSNVAIGNIGGQMKLGGNTVRLTVTGPGGTAYVEHIIIVNPRPITCDFTGTLNVLPTALNQTYNGVVNNVNGRTVEYAWTVTGPVSTPSSGNTQNFSTTFSGEGTYTITFTARTLAPQYPDGTVGYDGVSCSETKTVNVSYPALDCQMTGDFTPDPNGNNYTYTANVLNAAGRSLTYIWEYSDDNGASWSTLGDTDADVTLSWTLPDSDVRLRYTANATPGGASCNEERGIVVEYPALTCSIEGSTTPRPVLPDDPDGVTTRTYTATVGGLAGRNVSYSWTATGPNGPYSGTGSTFVLPSTDWTDTDDSYTITLTITTDGGGGPYTCNASNLDATFTVLNHTCLAPLGDTTPVVGETVTYSAAVDSRIFDLYGRPATTTWTIEQWDFGTSTWGSPTTISSGDSYTVAGSQSTPPTFTEPGARYRVRYTVNAIEPARSCTNFSIVNVYNVGANFECEGWSASSGTVNDYTPGSSSTNYIYRVLVDNTLGYNLHYNFVLIENGVERTIYETDSTVDAPTPLSTTPINGTVLGPIGNKILRVYVTPAVGETQTTYSCQMEQALAVGSYNVSYTVDTAARDIAIGEQICLTNSSTISHPPHTPSLVFDWDFGTANNSLGVATITNLDYTTTPVCLSFSAQGTYNIRLRGASSGFGNTDQQTIQFRVWTPQSILINRLDSNIYAGSTVSFQAAGVNINSYQWNIYPILSDNSNGTPTNPQNQTGTTINKTLPLAGRYRVVVVGTGPLGTTTAQYEFELLNIDDIRAAFRASQYAGVSPMYVCFTDRSVGNNITDWRWNFGNGQTLVYTDTTIPPQICTTYSGSGGEVFIVTLEVENENGLTANASNQIRLYTLQESQSTFSIEPQGGAQYCFRAVLASGVTVTGWDFGDGTSITTTDEYVCHNYGAAGEYRVTMIMSSGSVERIVTVSSNPGTPPNLSVVAQCSAERTATFTVTNGAGGGAMTTQDQVIIRDLNGNVILIDTLMLGAGESVTYTLTNQSGLVTFETVDTALSASTECYYPPEISVSATCSGNLPLFTVSNNRPADGPMAAPQSFEIRDSANNLVASGSFQLTLGEASEQFAVPSGNNPYDTYTFISDGAVGTFNVPHSCGVQPVLQVTSACADPIAFTVRNNGGAMVEDQAYTVVNTGGITVASGNLNLGAGAETIISLTGLNPYAGYTFSTTGFAGDATMTQNCDRPVLEVTSACADPIAFTVRNNGGSMVSDQTYMITNTNGDMVAMDTLNLSAGAETIIPLTGLDPYAGYTFLTVGFAGDVSMTQNCDRPQLTAETTCAETVSFTVLNSGGDMLSAQPYTVTDDDGVTVDSGNLYLANGESVEINMPAANPYGEYTLNTAGFAGTLNTEHNCDDPVLAVTYTCAPVTFFVTNNGADMLLPHTYHVTMENGADVSGSNNRFQLASGETLTIDLSLLDFSLAITFTTGDYGITAENTMGCQPIFANATATPTGGSFNGLSDLGNWGAAQTCGYNCPPFRLYHTDETGDWEIFRLDGANPETRETYRRNLSYGENAEDMAPSLSPNTQWIAFSSNRDGNWELYVASTSGDPSSIQRMTYNSIAHDTDPMWGPGNFVVYETTRHGNWDLYMIDMSTGQEYRLTDSTSDDINPYWSPDGSRIAFQSNREDENGEHKWQIYELDLSTRTTTRLSDTTSIDVDPQYSNSGAQIVYRSYSADGANSVIAIMDANGQNRHTITNATGDATNPVWSPADRYIAYQSNLDGDLDIYIYEVATGQTRHLTDNTIDDYAPTWPCSEERVIFTSDIAENPDIYEADTAPISDPAIAVEVEADQMTFELSNDIYPESGPVEENASREGQTVLGAFGLQTSFLNPAADTTPVDLSIDGLVREDWQEVIGCP